MIFASKSPRDLNRDPAPFRIWTGPWAGTRAAQAVPGMTELDPRPEFGHVQHNQPNPILVAFRNRAEDVTLDYWAWALEAEAAFGGWSSWNHSDHPAHSLTIATDAQIDHARRVLERLANFAG